MKRIFYILAIVSALSVIVAWVALGSNTGWTKTKTTIVKVDPITEIEFTEYQDGFVPGVDFLAAGLGGSAALFAVGFILSKLSNRKRTP